MHWGEISLAVGVPLSLFTFAFIVGCFEQLPVRMFAPSEPGNWMGYLLAMASQATEMGYAYIADGQHTKYKEKLPAVLFISPDRSTLALIAAGTILGLPTRKTMLMSRLKNGEFLFTLDDAGTCELDPLTRRQILIKSTFQELSAKHAQALQSTGPFEPFPAVADWSCVDKITRERVERMVAAGAARYAGNSREAYCKTMSGAFRASILHGVFQSFRPTNVVRHSFGAPDSIRRGNRHMREMRGQPINDIIRPYSVSSVARRLSHSRSG